ncbi:MAG: hypothetical protein AB9866_29665 [Syntrophobacteraceae bacterium]
MAAIAIKENILGGEQFCAMCGGLMASQMGPDLFMEGTMQLVCRECGRDYVPHLVHLLELGERVACS